MTYGKSLPLNSASRLFQESSRRSCPCSVPGGAHRGTHAGTRTVCLDLSGGHTLLYHVQAGVRTETSPHAASSTRSVALATSRSEAMTKLRGLLAIGYPGGPVIDSWTRTRSIPRTCPWIQTADCIWTVKIKGNPYRFSFSGIKTAVLYILRATEFTAEIDARRAALQEGRGKPPILLPLCSSPTSLVISNFKRPSSRSRDAIRLFCGGGRIGRAPILVSGGVAANSACEPHSTPSSAPRA